MSLFKLPNYETTIVYKIETQKALTNLFHFCCF